MLSHNEQLRVMHVIRDLNIGGAQEVVRTVTAYLAEAGCYPVVCTFKDGPLRQEIEQRGIPVEVLPDRQYSIVALPLFVWDMLRVRRALIAVAKKHQVNVLQTHLLRVLDFVVLSLRWRRDGPAIFWTIHNYNFTLRADQLQKHRWLLRPKRFMYRHLYRTAAGMIDGFIAVSDEVAMAIRQIIDPPSSKLTVICNGVDVQRYQQPIDRTRLREQLKIPGDARLIAMVGTMKLQKGHRYLLEALPAIIAQFPDVHVVLIGDGVLREALQAQTRALGLDRYVHFLGSRGDVPALLAASDYFVLPSLWEGLPMALIEAMATGLPIVATSVSGTNQVMIDNETGLVVLPRNARQLADAVLWLVSDHERAQSMGRAAQRRVETMFSAQQQAEAHIALYRRAVCHERRWLA